MRTSHGSFLLASAVFLAAVAPAHAAGLESSDLKLILNTDPNTFSFQLINKSTNAIVLSSSATSFGSSGVTGVSASSTGNDGQHDYVDLSFALAGGGSATGRFTLTTPNTVQVDYTGPAGTSVITQLFADNGEHYYGTWQTTFTANLDNRGLNQLFDGTSLSSTSVEGSRAPYYFTSNNVGVYTKTLTTGSYQFAVNGQSGFTFNTTDGSGSNTSLRYTLMVGNSPKDVVKQFNATAGTAFMPPTWAFDSFWWRDDEHQIPSQATAAGVTNAQQLVLADADMLQQLHIPSGAIWIDRPYGTGSGTLPGWGNFDFDSSFPDPAQMVADMKARGMNLLLWVANRANAQLRTDAVNNGYLLPSSKTDAALDLRIPGADALFLSDLQKFVDMGFKGYKIDRGGEGEMPKILQNEIPNLFAQLTNDSFTSRNINDFFVFGRDGNDAARQNIGIWDGDSSANFTGLQTSMKHALRSGLVGFPFWASDTGGYNGTPTKELFARWLEFSTYSPMMEILNGPNRNIWYNYDQQLINIAVAQTQTHHDMIPYTRSAMAEALADGMPIMRALLLEFPNDPNVADMWDEFLDGHNLLVAPVTTSGATSRSVYLPAGRWVDYRGKSQVFNGGQTITASAAIDVIPVYAREGAIIPHGDIIQDNQNWKPNWSPHLTIDVFPTDQFKSTFDYYTDAGATQTIESLIAGNTLHIDFADLGVNGELDIYLGRFFNFTSLGAVKLNGQTLNPSAYTYDSANQLLIINYTGATTLDVVLPGVPEPASLALFTVGGLTLLHRKRSK